MKTRNMKMFKVGPIWSRKFDKSTWDEMERTMISNVYVSFDDWHIKSIQFSYIENGAQVVSKKYGSSAGHYFQIMRLNHDDYVTGVSRIDWEGEITSLTFHTNQRKHGPICTRFDYFKEYKRTIDVGIRDRREFGGFFGSFCNTIGCLSSIGIYFCPITSINEAVLRAKFEVTDDQLTRYQSSDPLATTTHNRTLVYHQIPEVLDGFHVKPKFKDELTLYQSSDPIARSSHNRTVLEYQSLKFLDGVHVSPIGRKFKLKDRIFSKLDFRKAISRLFRNLLD